MKQETTLGRIRQLKTFVQFFCNLDLFYYYIGSKVLFKICYSLVAILLEIPKQNYISGPYLDLFPDAIRLLFDDGSIKDTFFAYKTHKEAIKVTYMPQKKFGILISKNTDIPMSLSKNIGLPFEK